jgi:Raf kinase inhibitor-like YbhB/YbcL family protein
MAWAVLPGEPMKRTTSALLVLVLAGCLGPDPADETPTPTTTTTTPAPASGVFSVASGAFAHMGDIPRRHTCDDANVSPTINFTYVPGQAATIALIMEDPDAPSGTVLHWTFWNLPANATALQEDVDIAALGGREGQTYRGPCPPDGEHRYFFYAFAVNGTLALQAGASVSELRSALDGRILAEATMYGLYCRPNQPPLPCLDPRATDE